MRRRTRELTAAGGVGQRLIRRVRRAKMLRRALFVMMVAHFTSYDMVMMAPVVHALPEMLKPWRELSNAEFTRVTRFGIARFLECADALTLLPETLIMSDGSKMSRRLALFTVLRRWTVPDAFPTISTIIHSTAFRVAATGQY
eukprot:COSAG02_NODE_4250_length_5586_cov_2.460725_6_plen_143_part_00